MTFEECDRFATATGRALPRDEGWDRADRPIINVNWHDAQAYAEWLSLMTGKRYRLPAEAEWEYAARAGTETRYWWDDEIGQGRTNCRGCGSKWDSLQTGPVKWFPPNALGLYDTAGNVYEWVQDCYMDSYEGVPVDGSAKEEPDCDHRVFRGGSWDDQPDRLRSVARGWGYQEAGENYNGFRLAQDR